MKTVKEIELELKELNKNSSANKEDEELLLIELEYASRIQELEKENEKLRVANVKKLLKSYMTMCNGIEEINKPHEQE
jgi:hypothetical protein